MSQLPEPVHYEIHVYDNGAPPLGQPTATSLCILARRLRQNLTGAMDRVTCEECRRLIRYLQLDRD